MVKITAAVVFTALTALAGSAWAQTSRPDAAGDVSVGYAFMRDSSSRNFNGFRLSGAKNMSESWAIVAEGGRMTGEGGVYLSSSGRNEFSYADTALLGGIRLRRFDGSSTTPFFQVLGGYYGRHNSLYRTTQGNFAVRAEIGFDYRVGSRVALRGAGGWTLLSGGVRHLNQIGATAGLAFLLGGR